MRAKFFLTALSLAVPLIAADAAVAADPVTVAPGKPILLVTTGDPITEAAAQYGHVICLAGESSCADADAKQVTGDRRLYYFAPSNVQHMSETVTYKRKGTAETQLVEVRDPDPTSANSIAYAQSFAAIFQLFVLAVLLESGLALIFRWKPFITLFDTKAVNAIVALAFSYAFVTIFNIDIAGRLLVIYGALPDTAKPTPAQQFWGPLLTAMIVAGGSAGVNRILQTMGFRPTAAQETPVPKPIPEKGWVAIKPVRDKAEGPITVFIGPPGGAVAAGTIADARFAHAQGWQRFFLRDRGRFPPSGGFAVAPGTYQISLGARDGSGNIVSSTIWGPYAIAAGAIIDLEMKI